MLPLTALTGGGVFSTPPDVNTQWRTRFNKADETKSGVHSELDSGAFKHKTTFITFARLLTTFKHGGRVKTLASGEEEEVK